MAPQPSCSSVPVSTSSVRPARQFLIPRSVQQQFAILFAIASCLGLFAGIWTSQIVLIAIPLRNFFLLRFVENFVVGAGIGVAQSLVLRNYISGWSWLVATSFGWSISAIFAQAWDHQVNLVFSSIFYLGLGIAQWLVLRRYASAARWWILIAPVSVYMFRWVTHIIFFTLVQTNLSGVWQIPPFTQILIQTIFGAIALGVIQAISLCSFRHKAKGTAVNFISQLNSPLFSAPEISDRSLIPVLSQLLVEQFERAIKPKTTQERDLIYIVAVAENGEIVFYQPVNQAAIYETYKTPLPQLSQQYSVAANREPVARFRVTFTSNGAINIRY